MTEHADVLRRRRQGLTDYRSRRRAIISKKPLLVVRFSNKNVSAQFLSPRAKGDEVLSASHSHELSKLGWKGSLKSTPACYLLGMLAAEKAIAKGVKEAVLYNGVVPFIHGSRVAAFLKGAVDAGLTIPVGEEAFPKADRLSGKDIADYAGKLLGEDKAAYEKRFSRMLKSGFKPEDYPANFEKTKAAVAGGTR